MTCSRSATPNDINRGARIIAKIHCIWSCALQVDDFSDDDNFYSLGGDSLTMIRIGETISDQLGFDVPADELFRRLTVVEIANYVSLQITLSPVVERATQSDPVQIRPAGEF